MVSKDGRHSAPDDLESNLDCSLLMRELENRIAGATVPIYFSSASSNGLVLNRSAVLVRIGSDYLLLTAAHGLQELSQRGIRAFTQQADEPDASVELTGCRVAVVTEPADIAAIQVSAAVVERMGRREYAVCLSEVDFIGDWDYSTPFVLCGYPSALEEHVMSLRGILSAPKYFLLLTGGFEGDIEGDRRAPKSVQVVIDLPKAFRPTGQTPADGTDDLQFVRTPKPQGLSGGAIWRVGLATPESHGKDQLYECRLTAIQHSAHRGLDYAVGTCVPFALMGIWSAFPLLRPEIEAARPGVFPLRPFSSELDVEW